MTEVEITLKFKATDATAKALATKIKEATLQPHSGEKLLVLLAGTLEHRSMQSVGTSFQTTDSINADMDFTTPDTLKSESVGIMVNIQ